MNKRDAKAKSTSGTVTIGECRRLIAAARVCDRGEMSKVNRALSLRQAYDIYEAAIAGRDDAEAPAGMRANPYRPARYDRTKDSLIIQNILRDCA